MIRIFYLIILSLILFSHASGQVLNFVEDSGGITLYDNGKPVYKYQIATKTFNGTYPRANYIHPLFGLDGEILTEDFPEDHPHQRFLKPPCT